MSLSQGRGKRGDPSAGEKTKARSTSGSLLKIPSVCVVEGTAGIARPAEEVAGAEDGRLEAREEVAIALLTRRWRCGKKRKHIAPPIDFLHIEKGQVKRLSEVRSRVEGKSSSASRATSRRAEGKREFPFYRKQAGPRDRRYWKGGTGRPGNSTGWPKPEGERRLLSAPKVREEDPLRRRGSYVPHKQIGWSNAGVLQYRIVRRQARWSASAIVMFR